MEMAWHEWGQILFEKTIKEDKVIFLYLDEGDQETRQMIVKEIAQDKSIGGRLPKSFLSVFVNGPERPDISMRYSQGGLPSLVFLTPKGQIITGYVGPSLTSLADFLEQVEGIYKVAAWGGRFSGVEISSSSAVSFEEKRLYFIKYKEQFLSSFQTLVTKTDPGSNGLRSGISNPEVLEFCLERYKKNDEPILRSVLEKSLESLAEGGGFDFLDGGFLSIQFKKRLVDNLNLSRIYLSAGKVLGDARFSQTAQKTIEFINRWLYNFDNGSFYVSLSGEEGYYKLASRTERLTYREQYHQPQVDQTIYTDLNARAADFYFGLGQGEVALKTINLLLTSLRSPAGLFFHFQKEGKKYYDWFLSDQVYLVKCLLNPVLASSAMASDLKPRTMAQDLWKLVMEKFYDREAGGFFDRRQGIEDWGLLKNPIKPIEENVEAIRILRQLGYEEEARRSLVEIFWQNKIPSLRLAPLAALLLDF